jgi:uncharacterized membrane protein YcaP (DUF421 family)
MKKEQIHLGDIKRILFGQQPPEYLIEVFVRALIIYLCAMVIMRFMGKRMNGMHSIIELSVMVMMGAIVAPAMQIPDRGITWGILVLFGTLLLLRGLNWLGFKNSGVEKAIQGRTITLISEGVLNRDELEKTKITNQQVFEELRSKNIYNLGRIKRLYMEGYGLFSVYEQEPKPGLPIYPQIDRTIIDSYEETADNGKACTFCGLVQMEAANSCSNCGRSHWTKAIIGK